MWRLGTPMQQSMDVNPHYHPDRVYGVLPRWYDLDEIFLVDDAAAYLQDDDGAYIIDPLVL